MEIERKFLVNRGLIPAVARFENRGVDIRQGWLNEHTRIRILFGQAFLTVKPGDLFALVRYEWELQIPFKEAQAVLDNSCPRQLTKIRRRIPANGDLVWELDTFTSAYKYAPPPGKEFMLAEIELPSIDTVVELPPWVGREVTGDPRYYNYNLAMDLRWDDGD